MIESDDGEMMIIMMHCVFVTMADAPLVNNINVLIMWKTDKDTPLHL